MESYEFEATKKVWNVGPEQSSYAKRIYSTYDYYYIGWEIARHGVIILDRYGIIVDANPYFCDKIGYTNKELTNKPIEQFCIVGDDLFGSDKINTTALIRSNMIQQIDECKLRHKSEKLYKCRWVANRVPADLTLPFSHSIVHVYFIAEANYSKIISQVEKLEKKESNMIYSILDSTWAKTAIFLIIILTALGGDLTSVIKLFF